MTDKPMKIADVSKTYDISLATAYRHWREWPHFLIGSSPRFRRDELDRHFSNDGRLESERPKARAGHLVIPRRIINPERRARAV